MIRNKLTGFSISGALLLVFSMLPGLGQTLSGNPLAKTNAKLKDMAHHQQTIDARQDGLFKKSQEELNLVYNSVMKEYANDKLFVEKLKVSQEAWLKYRDAYVESVFPEPNKMAAYGSICSTCTGLIIQELTEQRTKQLKRWLDGVEEGDSCAGSVHPKKS